MQGMKDLAKDFSRAAKLRMCARIDIDQAAKEQPNEGARPRLRRDFNPLTPGKEAALDSGLETVLNEIRFERGHAAFALIVDPLAWGLLDQEPVEYWVVEEHWSVPTIRRIPLLVAETETTEEGREIGDGIGHRSVLLYAPLHQAEAEHPGYRAVGIWSSY